MFYLRRIILMGNGHMVYLVLNTLSLTSLESQPGPFLPAGTFFFLHLYCDHAIISIYFTVILFIILRILGQLIFNNLFS